MNDQTSAVRACSCARVLPWPWPLSYSRRISTGLPLGDRAPDEDPPGAAAIDAEARLAGVSIRDQPFARGDRILPGVGLGRLAPREMPVLAERAAAAYVRDRIHSAALDPCIDPRIE